MSPLSRAAWRSRRLLRRKCPPALVHQAGTVVATGLTALTAVETSLRLLIGIATLRRPVMPDTGRVPSSNALRRCLTSSQRPPTRYGRPVFEHPVPPSSTPRSPDSPEESVGKVLMGSASVFCFDSSTSRR